MKGDNQYPQISFDDEYHVRVLEKDHITHTQELEAESNQFATSKSNTNCNLICTIDQLHFDGLFVFFF
jgi:hypothetical protein